MSPTWVARLVALVWILSAAGEASAQGVETSDIPSIEPAPGTAESAPEAGSGVTPLVAPLPFKNSQIGWGVALMLGLIHRLDADTTVKPSTGAIVGLASENGSWGVMGMEMARLGRDTWRARGVAGYMDLQYDFYGIGLEAGEAGQSVPIDQTFFIASGALLRHVVSGLYLGGQIVWLTTTVTPQDAAGPNDPALPDQARTDLLAGGLQAEFDTRDDDYWPQRGSLAQLKGNFFTTTTGASGSFQRYQAAWSVVPRFPGPAPGARHQPPGLWSAGRRPLLRSLLPRAPADSRSGGTPRGAIGTTTPLRCRWSYAGIPRVVWAPCSLGALPRWPRKSRRSSTRSCFQPAAPVSAFN